MKQLELELNKNLLLVEFPGDFYFTWMPAYIFFQSVNGHELLRIEGNFKFICMGDKLTEEIAKELATKKMYYRQRYYKDFKDDRNHLESPVKSFISAIEVTGFWWGENPLGSEPNDVPDLGEFTVMMRKKHKQWKEAESRTFNPKQTYIFEKL